MIPARVPEDVLVEARRLGESIAPSRERRPSKSPEDHQLATEELRVVRELQMFAAQKHGDELARRLRVSFSYAGGKTETRVFLDRTNTPARGPALTIEKVRKLLEQTLKGRSS